MKIGEAATVAPTFRSASGSLKAGPTRLHAGLKAGATVLACIVALSAWPGMAQAQLSPQLAEMLHRVFVGKEFDGKEFGPARWWNEGESYTTLEPSTQIRGAKDIVKYDTASGARELLVAATELIPPDSKAPLAINDYSWSKDMKSLLIYTNSRRVWRQNTRGDYWVLDLATKKLQKLGGNVAPSTLMFAKFSPNGAMVAYVRDQNIYVEDLVHGSIVPLTQNGSPTLANGTSDWVYEEEFDLRDGFRWSPDGHSIAYWQIDSSGEGDFPLIYDTGGPYDVVSQIPYPQYGVYPRVKNILYPQPGTTNPAARIGVVKASGGPTQWIAMPGDPRNNYIPYMAWAGNSQEIVVQHMNRLQSTDDVLLADVQTGSAIEVYREHDDTWVDVVEDLPWVHNGKDFLWVSEKDGWRHVYLVSRDGKQSRLVTPGQFDVIHLEGVDAQENWVYYIASPDSASQRYLYRSRLDGPGEPERVTPLGPAGSHSYQISPNFEWAIHTFSTSDLPPVTDLVTLPAHQVNRVLEDNHELRSKTAQLFAQPTEFFPIDIGNGVALDAFMIKPPRFDPAKKYPILIHVYGEPAGQTVVDQWGGQQGIFHRLIADRGYLIASVDNRGTPAPKGRAWRKIIYGTVGVLSSQEQAAALRAMEKSRAYIDPNRTAVWGWSGGGTNTLNLMFRYPEVYKVGMAVAPVPDQRLYDTIYQERYMGLPQQNTEGYRQGSAINFAEGLQGHLLLVHGSDDDNVHFQGSELLINRLVELGKPFDMMEYPGRTHSLSEGKDTHYHLFSLLARYLQEHLPPGPMAHLRAGDVPIER
jgi:dipeptidyl-peptidase-4